MTKKVNYTAFNTKLKENCHILYMNDTNNNKPRTGQKGEYKYTVNEEQLTRINY